MKKYLLIIICCMIAFSVNAQYFSKIFSDGSANANFKKALLTRDSSFAIFGSIFDGFLTNGLFIKLDRSGDTLFTCKYSSERNIIFNDIAECNQDSSFFITGMTTDTGNFYPSQTAFISRFDKVGNILWQKNYQPHDSLTTISDFKIVDDTLYVVANTQSNGFLLKLDLSGNVLTELKFETIFLSHLYIKSDRSILLTGSDYDNGVLLKINPQGNILWSYADNIVSGGYGFVHEMSNGHIKVVCNAVNVMGQSSYSYIHEFDSIGNIITTCFFDVAAYNYCFTQFDIQNYDAISIVGAHYYPSGGGINFKLEIDSAFNVIQYKTEPSGFGNYCLLKIDERHEMMCGNGNIFVYDPLLDNCHFADTVSGSTALGPWVFPNVISIGSEYELPDVTVSTFNWIKENGLTINNDCISLSSSYENEISIDVFPNPTNEKFSISNNSFVAVRNIKLFNVNGIEVREFTNVKNGFDTEVTGLQKGMYFIFISFENGSMKTEKVILQ